MKQRFQATALCQHEAVGTAKQLNHVVTQMIEASVATDDEENTEK